MIGIALLLFSAPLAWAPRQAGEPLPPDAVRVTDKGPLYVCRAQLPDGVHPGVTTGGPCLVPQKGKTESFDSYELAKGTAVAWRAADWEHAIASGRQRVDLYVCRATVATASGGQGVAGGKAYRDGAHAGHCFVTHDGREIDAPRFELLVIK